MARLRAVLGLLALAGLGGMIATSASDRPLNAAQDVVATGVMRGMVVDARTGSPVQSASVQVSSTDGAFERGAVSREDGRFEVRELPEGGYRVVATKAGYLSARFGQAHFADPEAR